ncbi:hypothetical protein ACHHRT_01165 [Desulfurivibrio sp. D14AmB]|uniref:hypothetical protein n=1 Tax=Desulfurivibrio sp. D14AmB TaxID=3374370 RepID=UPI00376F249C
MRSRSRWLGPLPIWSRPGPAGLRLSEAAGAGQPAILRFDHDEFMPEYLAVLHGEPQRLGEWLARPETWRRPMATPKPTPAPAGPASRVDFLFEKTRQATAARKPTAAATLNLKPCCPGKSAAGTASAAAAAEPPSPLKLYQATHKRHYLVSASLVSEEPGLPDCVAEPGRPEKAGFLLRRLLPPAAGEAVPLEHWDEYAFFAGPKGNSWRRLGPHQSAAVDTLAVGEEQLPLFPVSFRGSCQQRRRLFSGVIPVSRREQWVGAEVGGDIEADPAPEGSGGPGLAALLLQAEVVAPWQILLEQAAFKKEAAERKFNNFASNRDAQDKDHLRLLRTARDEIQTTSWYLLLDFARLLRDQLPAVWRVLTGAADIAELDDGEALLVNILRHTTLPRPLATAVVTVPFGFPFRPASGGLPGGTRRLGKDTRYGSRHLVWNLAAALVAALAAESGLERVETTFTRYDDEEEDNLLPLDPDWPDFLFPLADPELAAPVPAVPADRLTGLSGLERQLAAVEVLAELVERLLPAADPEQLLDTVPAGDQRQAWFVIRCVYQRPACGPLFPPLVSAPSRPFQMAPFFDPDAPARPVRIPMPLDISPAGLRKFQKNTGFVLSDMLCGQVKRIRKMTLADLVLSVLPWPFHKSLPNPGKSGPCKDRGGGGFGMICSLSIPIVTLCAMILMMIIVALFDLFFRWIPYLFTCLPIPGLKGKGSSDSDNSG